MKKALRIGCNRYYEDAVFEEHLRYVERNLDVIDEVSIFTEAIMHTDWKLEEQAERAALIARRIEQYRSIGVRSVGINVLSTIGHCDEGWDLFEPTGLQHFTGPSGEESKSCLCYVNDDFLEYTIQKYVMYASAKPDFIWIDDDLRIWWHGIEDGCYCDGCIARFNAETGGTFTRQSLVEAMKTDAELSHRWFRFRADKLTALLHRIASTIHTVNPAIEIGMMNCYEHGRQEWMKASGAVKGRPGGGQFGFYTDDTPITLFERGFAINYSIEKFYPEEIVDILWENENMCYQTFGKSMAAYEMESTMALMCGCHGVLYNPSVYDDREDVMQMLRGSKKKWETLLAINRGCKRQGVYCVNNMTSYKLNLCGIPTTAAIDNAWAAFVLGDEWNGMTDAEIDRVLRLNTLTDGRGLEILCKRGFESRCGGHVNREIANSMAERFLVHPLNGAFHGYYRDVIMSYFFESNAYELAPAEKSECLARLELENVPHKPAGCSFYVYENEDGARFAANGYLMPSKMNGLPKRTQITNVFEWLSGGMPIRFDRHIKIVPTVMSDGKGTMTILITNASLDQTGAFLCIVKAPGPFYRLEQDGRLTPIASYEENGNTHIAIDNIEQWRYLVLTNKA